ncbi:MAG: transposase [Elusimicrobiota bacterium]
MNIRKFPIATGEIYHIFNKSISGYVIFNAKKDYEDFLSRVLFYNSKRRDKSFSGFMRTFDGLIEDLKEKKENSLVQIISYCLMPTHFHFILKQLEDGGISSFISNICDSYTRHFNLNHKRKGPLWQGNFKDVLIKTDEQLLHITRYIHLNPSTSYIVENPIDWEYSSYSEYLGSKNKGICDFLEFFNIKSEEYRNFVEDRISYQRDLSKIKDLIIE